MLQLISLLWKTRCILLDLIQISDNIDHTDLQHLRIATCIAYIFNVY